MAWPCITRACCINRFWTELDKADIAVPLVFTKYSDVTDVQRLQHHHPQPKHRPNPEEPPAADEAPPAAGGAAAAKDGSAASVMRQDFQAWRVRPEPSCKPRNEYHPPPAPFSNETQYQKDYKPWPIPRKHDHPWITKPWPAGGPERSGAGGQKRRAAVAESGAEKSEMEEKIQEKEVKVQEKEVKVQEKEVKVQEKEVKIQEKEVKVQAKEVKVQAKEVKVQKDAKKEAEEQRRGRAAADAVNKQIKEVMSTSSSYRTEFKAYKDVKPVKPIKAPSQYKPPGEETSLETCYSATFKGEQVKGQKDNKLQERRRIRSLYSEPTKEPAKVDKPASRTKPKKPPTTKATGKMVKKAKEKQISSSQSAKKKPSSDTKPEGVVTKKSKEISNRLAEAKQ
ncbi:microtubule-associated protein 6 homolog [Nematolebias whitei]|uniref:microtubule-associated protein 6 homolog n=1 Tax=Nematolebias whitei TaxID=451745 RepID=UPI001897E02E|nr:microtubule-associated protein 6 homolog [Nematolebias whitei]